MGPTERKFSNRLDRRVAEASEAAHNDAVRQTDGVLKREEFSKRIEDHSALVRSKPAWVDQQVATQTVFSKPEGYYPGEHHYETGLSDHVTQAARAFNFDRDFICGEGASKSAWRPPPVPRAGTNRKASKAALLLKSPARKRTAEAVAAKREQVAFGTLLSRTASAPALLKKGPSSEAARSTRKPRGGAKILQKPCEDGIPQEEAHDILVDRPSSGLRRKKPARLTVVVG